MKADIFTSEQNFIAIASKHVSIQRVYCEAKKISPDLFDFCKWNEYEIVLLEDVSHAATILSTNCTASLAFSFGYGLIFESSQLERYEHGIWNIHTGELPKYRGRHPITHAFLENEKEICVTVHQLDQKIDQGKLIASGSVRRTFQDNETTILQKILKLLDTELLATAIENYAGDKLHEIPYAPYKQNFNDGISLHSLEMVSQEFLYNAIQSQVSHGGLNIGGVIYLKCHYYSSYINYDFPWIKTECLDGPMMLYPKLPD